MKIHGGQRAKKTANKNKYGSQKRDVWFRSNRVRFIYGEITTKEGGEVEEAKE